MLSHIALGIGLVLVIEGLVLALAPSRLDEMLKALSEIPPETRRMMGLGTVAAGVVLVWISKGVAG